MVNWKELSKIYSYDSYRELVESLVVEKKTRGPEQSESYISYTRLNFQRLKRIEKTIDPDPSFLDVIRSVESEQIWLIIVEAWCGDVAQSLPIINKAVSENVKIELRIVLRDENLKLIDKYLTNGSRSIPKLIILEKSTSRELGVWGPRPDPAQAMLLRHKADPQSFTYPEFSRQVQDWYNEDQGKTMQEELKSILLPLVSGMAQIH